MKRFSLHSKGRNGKTRRPRACSGVIRKAVLTRWFFPTTLSLGCIYTLGGFSSLWWIPPLLALDVSSISDDTLMTIDAVLLAAGPWSVVVLLLTWSALQAICFWRKRVTVGIIVTAFSLTALMFAGIYTSITVLSEWQTTVLTYQDCKYSTRASSEYVMPDGTIDVVYKADAFAGRARHLYTLEAWSLFYELPIRDRGLYREEIAAVARTPEQDAVLFHPERRVHCVVDMLHYSFATITTLGLGDITPQLPLTKALAILEQLLGLSLVVLALGRLFARGRR